MMNENLVGENQMSEKVKTIIQKQSKRDEHLPQLENVMLETFHYKPSTEIAEHLQYFATLHKYDDRVAYKESWDAWVKNPNIAELIESEIGRLRTSGYYGDALSKIYKSARYYYRKKTLVETVEKKKRKKYEGLNKEVLDAMDSHIAQCIKSHVVKIIQTETNMVMKSNIAPNDAYKTFMETLDEPVVDEVMEKKYKKTFKNRFFLYRNKLNV